MARSKISYQSELALLRKQLEHTFPNELVNSLLDSFNESQRHYFLGEYRDSCLDAARFTEVCLRMLQHVATGAHTPLQNQLSRFPDEVTRLSHVPSSNAPDSIRLIIPKVLQTVYDIRNKRNIGHTGGDIDENFADANLSIASCSWVLAELIRIYYSCDIHQAQNLVDNIVEIKFPLIQDFNGFLKILDNDLSVANKILVVLYYRAEQGATYDEIVTWIGKKTSANTKVSLGNLTEQSYVHKDQGGKANRYFITKKGEKFVIRELNLRI